MQLFLPLHLINLFTVRPSTFASAADILRKSASLFEKHFPAPLAIADLASQCHVSPKTLTKVFAAIVGEAPMTTMKRWRIKKLARSIVRQPEQPLLWHGMETGITFTRLDKRLFKEMYCQDLSTFKRTCRPSQQLAPSTIPWDQECDASREIELILQARGYQSAAATPVQAASQVDLALVA
jgi:AraC-like DNA-binding protein